ncbi:hypothetical protein PM082_010595 [Marasmius tenuissimus]|nr:hypothetical protein PM082_010595 [Marasmius tenuissimus]
MNASTQTINSPWYQPSEYLKRTQFDAFTVCKFTPPQFQRTRDRRRWYGYGERTRRY